MKFRSLILGGLIASLGSLSIPLAQAGKADDTLVVAFNKEVQTLDGLYSTSRENLILTDLTSDQLVVLDPKTNTYVPALAKSYRYITDTSLEFTLREGIKFHDGSSVTVEDIIYSFNFASSEEAKSKRGTALRSWLKNVEKTGPNTLVIHSKAPTPLIMRDISMFALTRKNQAYHQGNNVNLSAMNEKFIGTGPYKIVSYSSGTGIKLERFEGYYKDSPKGQAKIKDVAIRAIPDWSTVIAEMMSGGVDWTYNVPDEIADNLNRTPLVDRIEGPSMRIAYLVLDAAGVSSDVYGKDHPLTKLKVRQALNYAVNSKLMVDFLVKGSSRVINSPCYSGMFGCSDAITTYSYNPQKAKALLAEAGYPNGFEFDLWAYRDKPISEAVAADLAKVGIKANVKYVKLSALTKARNADQIMAYHGTWGYNSTPDLGAIANHFIPGSSRNMNKNPELEELFEDSLKTIDKDTRQAKYNAGLKMMTENAYWVPLYKFSMNYAQSKEVNFTAPLDGQPRIYKISWK